MTRSITWYPPRETEEEFFQRDLIETQDKYLKEGIGTTIPEGFTVKLTCQDVPEQWDIFYDGEMIGYLRCRFSRWSLSYPDVGGEVLIAEPWHPEISEYQSTFAEERPAIFDLIFKLLIKKRLSEHAS